MPKTVHLSLVFHNHQPVGNFGFVFREAFDKSYLPLVEALERHPTIKVSLHFTGPLRDWLLENERDYYLNRMGALIRRGQVEIIGGAYYEPILVMLNEADKIGQMEMLNQAIASDFGVRPTGMWLAERVWEPYLAKPIAQSNLQYAIVDDTHFHYAGFNDSQLYGYYVTEEQSYPLRLFPASKMMRNAMPWMPVDGFINLLRQVADDPSTPENALLVAADDGEKFGLWLGTYQLCWEQGWVDDLFEALAANRDWLHTTTPGAYMAAFPALGRAYLPTASYIEMSTWSLPTEGAAELPRAQAALAQSISQIDETDPHVASHLRSLERYLRGGLWRNFMVKYPEVNHMQKRGIYISRRVHQLPDGDAKTQALHHLWAAQCNCAYWHGLFGGIYLFHIRAANYANLLAAEAVVLTEHVEVELVDFDMDSRDELVINAHPFSFVIDLPRGGALLEWDDMPSRYNLLNIMSRHREGYHVWLQESAEAGFVVTPEDENWIAPAQGYVRAKEKGLENHLIVDQHRRGGLIDHFFAPDINFKAFNQATYTEMGDFVQGDYQATVAGDGTTQATITLRRDGRVCVDEQWHDLRVEKRLIVTHGERTLPVTYTLTNTSDTALTLHFGIESAFGFDGGDSDYCYFEWKDEDGDIHASHLGREATHYPVDRYAIGTHIRHFEVTIELTKAAELWRFPLAPVTMSDAGYERVHQGAVFLHLYRLTLQPGEQWQADMQFTLRDL